MTHHELTTPITEAQARALRIDDTVTLQRTLYGIRDADQRQMASEGRVVKTLVSYGSAWFKWYMRRLAERPANVWFVARSVLPG